MTLLLTPLGLKPAPLVGQHGSTYVVAHAETIDICMVDLSLGQEVLAPPQSVDAPCFSADPPCWPCRPISTRRTARGVSSHTRDGTSMDTVTAVLQRIVCSLSSSTPRCLVSLARRYDSHFFDNTSSLFCCTVDPKLPMLRLTFT